MSCETILIMNDKQSTLSNAYLPGLFSSLVGILDETCDAWEGNGFSSNGTSTFLADSVVAEIIIFSLMLSLHFIE